MMNTLMEPACRTKRLFRLVIPEGESSFLAGKAKGSRGCREVGSRLIRTKEAERRGVGLEHRKWGQAHVPLKVP